MKKIFIIFIIGSVFTFLSPTKNFAAVSGACSNCHTMHNSQNGSSVTTSGDAVKNLLSSDCIGCHSSTDSSTIINLGGSMVPIVFNAGGYPLQPLAGGNFYYVAKTGAAMDSYGHNVWGLSDQDATLSKAPGNTQTCGGGGGTATGCHFSLAVDPALNTTAFATGKNGCEGCHLKLKHHGADIVAGQPETAESGWFRGLGGHFGGSFAFGVPGIESSDWEQSPSTANHNIYSARSDDYDRFLLDSTTPTITAYCVGCHQTIHQHTAEMDDTSSAWIRHPADRLLPETGEYAAYNPVSNYNATVPVGWTDINAPTRDSAAVICLSCHRAHGSEYPDMLRWDYNDMIAGGGASGEGCFVCHTTKDD